MTTTPLTPADTTLRNLLSLHRYWIYAEKLKVLFFKELMGVDFNKNPIESEYSELLLTDCYAYMFYWYGALYVVIEGYQELSISEDKLDLLLSDSRKDSLRRFRNGMFHYQAEYFSPKLLNFLASGSSVIWARSLHERLGEVLLARITAAQAAWDAATDETAPGT